MKRYEFQTIQSFLAHKDQEKQAEAVRVAKQKRLNTRNHRLFEWGLLVLIGVFCGIPLLFKKSPAPVPEARYIEGRFAASNINAKGDDRIYDRTVCGPEAIACASRLENTIWVSSDGDGYDRTSVMLHEIGHLLDVPHIEGDRLMDAKYQGTVEEPSEMAVAIVRGKQMKADGGTVTYVGPFPKGAAR